VNPSPLLKTTRNLLRASAVVLAVLAGGCATPESRIKESPAAFARLTPDQQALVRAGQVATGFDMDAVRLALGDPDRVVTVTNAAGRRQVWHYLAYGDDDGRIVFDGYYNGYNVVNGPGAWQGRTNFMGYPINRDYGYWAGPYIWSGAFIYNTVPSGARDRIRVIFDTTGHVAQVRQEKT
jgi:hypothetical protein